MRINQNKRLEREEKRKKVAVLGLIHLLQKKALIVKLGNLMKSMV